MLRMFCLTLLILGAVLAMPQGYVPKTGETILKLVVANRGEVYIQLHMEQAPRTTAKIVDLVQNGFYDAQTFYRVEKEPVPFLIQTGDPQSKTLPASDPSLGSGGTGTTVPFEDSGFPMLEGAVGLATDYSDRDTGDSQFFILLADKRFLEGNYTVFGKVVAGMDVVRRVELGDRIESAVILRG